MDQSTASPSTTSEIMTHATTGNSVTTPCKLHDYAIGDILNVSMFELDDIEMSTLPQNIDVQSELIRLCNMFFGNRLTNETNGLVIQYKNMKQYVTTNKLIGVVLAGINKSDLFITKYITNQIDPNTERYIRINLTVASITRTLLREYFTKDEINALCLECQANPN